MRRIIPRRSKFKANNNPLKIYRDNHPTLKTCIYAEACRSQRLANPTMAEDAMQALLNRMGVRFERERIVYYGNRFALLDFFLPRDPIGGYAIEVDGLIHKHQKKFDEGRDIYMRSIGIETIRIKNQEILRNPEAVALKIRELTK